MCLKHPNNAPVRIAEMMPIYDGNMWECNSFSEIMQWILDTYGNQAMVYFPEKGCHLGTNRSDNET